ncbi:MAG: AbgT family transporter [Planctomycetota bacterium]
MSSSHSGGGPNGILGWIEAIGNRLPDPAILFAIGTAIVFALSALLAPSLPGGFEVRWEADASSSPDELAPFYARDARDETGERIYDERGRPVAERARVEGETRPDGSIAARLVLETTGEPIRNDAGEPVDLADRGWTVFPVTSTVVTDPETGEQRTELVPSGQANVAINLLSSQGVFWLLRSMEKNLINFAPLGVVLLGMLGIGVAERSGLIGAALKAAMLVTPNRLLTPAMVLLGIMSSIGTDAGYVVLPPLAAALYASVGRSPLVGIAAVFAGVSAGFNANLLVTGLDPLLANLSTQGAQVVAPDRAVAATANWGFMFVSTFVVTAMGWFVTAKLVEPGFSRKPATEGGPDPSAVVPEDERRLSSLEISGMTWAGLTLALGLAGVGLSIAIPGAPLDYRAPEGVFPRWVDVVVPLLFILFVLPGIAYGVRTGVITRSADLTRLMSETIAGIAPIVVLAFFAGQFVAAFGESNLGRMLAFAGGQWLAAQDLSVGALIVAFILMTAVFNLFVGSMSAKYALFAPIFVPMLMIVGIRPELTQVAYRIGDSVTNIITPLNAYLIIILVFMRKHAPGSGIGTLIAMMLPYTVVFGIGWTVLLLLWMWLGWPLGPGDPGVVVPAPVLP